MQQLPLSAPRRDSKMPFRDNLQLDCLQDGFTAAPISRFSELTPYTFDDLRRDCQAWQGVSEFRLQLLTPVKPSSLLS